MEIIFRIFDTDYERAQKVESFLSSGLKARGIKGKVHLAFEYLEFSRMGLKSIPALEMNGVVLFQGRDLSSGLLDNVLKRLADAQRRMGIKNKSEV